MKTKLLLFLIIGLGFGLRFWQLGRVPVGFTPDEAAQGYTAWSIMKTGQDEWGQRFPLSLRSFGDYKPPLQTYLMIPAIAFFGLNEAVVRFPNALLSVLAIWGVFLLVKQLFNEENLALLASLFLAISPWHWFLSRGAFEANLTVFFISFGIYFLLRAIDERSFKYQLSAAIFLGLNLFSYHSAELFTPLAVILFLLFFWKTKGIKLKQLTIFGLIFLTFLLVAFSSFLTGGQIRGADIAIFNPTDNWQSVADQRWFALGQGLPDIVARLFHNKLVYVGSEFIKNYLSYFSLEFLFSQGPREATYGMLPGRGVVYLWQLPILFCGLYFLVKKPDKKVLLMLGLVLLSVLPAVLTKGSRMANRAAVMVPWLEIFIAWSLFEFWQRLKSKRLFLGALVFVGTVSLLFTFEDYFVQQPNKGAREMLYGRCQALKALGDWDRFETIVVSRKISEPQAYVTFCLAYSPWQTQKASQDWLRYQDRGLSFLDQLGEYNLDKFIFREINFPSDSQLVNAALIGLPEEFPQPAQQGADLITYPAGNPALVVYQTKTKPN